MKESTLQTTVEQTVLINKDLETLIQIAKNYGPEKYVNAYAQEKVNDHLDTYNNHMHQAKLTYEQGAYSVVGMDSFSARKLSLWKTYISILETAEVDTTGWTYNPKQQKLL